MSKFNLVYGENDIDNNNSAGNYVSEVISNPRNAMSDPRFLKDLRDFYYEKGENTHNLSDEDLVDKLYSDKTWQFLNVFSAGKEAYQSSGYSKEQKERANRIAQVYNASPDFWEEGGRGTWEFVKDAVPAMVADPTNFIAPVKGFTTAGQAARAAYAAGKNTTWAGVKAGAKRGAIIEGGISAGQEGLVNTAHQITEKNIGLRDEFSLGELGLSTAVGGVAGVGIGGGLGGIGGAVGTRGALKPVKEAEALGWKADDVVAMERAGTTPEDLVEQTKAKIDEDAKAPETEAEEVVEEISVEEADFKAKEDLLVEKLRDARQQLDKVAQTHGRDSDEWVAQSEVVKRISRLRQMSARLKTEQEQIVGFNVDEQDPAKIKQREARVSKFEDDYADWRAAVNGVDGPDGEELVTRADGTSAEATTEASQVQSNEGSADSSLNRGAEVVEVPAESGTTEPLSPETAGATTTDTGIPKVIEDDAPVPYSTARIGAKAKRIFAKHGVTEEDFRARINDTENPLPLSRSKKKPKQVTNNTLKAYDEELTGIQKTVDTDEAMPKTDVEVNETSNLVEDSVPEEIFSIKDDVKGHALMNGIDPNALKPRGKSKKITKATVNAEVKKGGEPSAYATQVQDELSGILDELKDLGEIPTEDLRRGVALLARGTPVSTDDILALFDALHINAPTGGSQRMEIKLTKTQEKAIKKQTRIIKKQYPGISDLVAERMATDNVLRVSEVDPTPVRGTGERIEQANIFASDKDIGFVGSAGKTSAGRIQSFMRRTTKHGTIDAVNPTEFAFDEALIKAQNAVSYGDGKAGPDIVPFVTTHPMRGVITSNGVKEVPAGTTLYADGVTKRAYESQELAVQVREGGEPKRKLQEPQVVRDNAPELGTESAPEPTPNTDATKLREILTIAENGEPELALDQFRELLRATKEKTGTDSVKTETPKLHQPVSKGDKLLIARSTIDPTDVRMISRKQAEDGKDITAIIGQKGGPKSDPNNWEFKYAPKEDWTSNARVLSALFESLPVEEGARPVGQRLYVGDATGVGEPTNILDLHERIIPDEIKERESFKALQKVAREANPDNPRELNTASDLQQFSRDMETAEWMPTVEYHREHASRLSEIYSLMDEIVPEGYVQPDNIRARSVEDIRSLFSKYSAEEIENAVDFIEKLGGDNTVGPRFIDSGDANNLSTQYTDAGEQVALSSTPHPKVPSSLPLYHEVAHWAYLNILTPQERATFWKGMEKYYTEGGGVDNMAIMRRVGPADPDGVIKISNMFESPAELFANQFELWATRQRHLSGDDNFWTSVMRKMKAIFKRYAQGVEIDPDLEPLFSKILPPAQRAEFKLGVEAKPKTELGKHINKRYVEYTLARADLEDAFLRDSADGIIEAHKALVKIMLSTNPKIRLGRRINANPDEKLPQSFIPLRKRTALIHNRIDDIDEMILGPKVEGKTSNDYIDDGLTEVADPQEVADRLRDFYYNGYEGVFQPANGLPAKVTDKNIGKTSLSDTLDTIEQTLKARYSETEGRALAGKPKLDNSKRSRRSRSSKSLKRARNQNRKSVEAVDNEALKTAKTAPKDRPRTSKYNQKLDKKTAKEVKSIGLEELRKLYVEHRGTEYGDQIAIELLRKNKATSLPARAVPIPPEMKNMSGRELEDIMLNGLAENNTTKIDQASYEMRRRYTNKGLKSTGQQIIQPKFTETNLVIETEIKDSVGVSSSDGIPASARASIRDILSYVTHRDPEIQYTARTLGYRMFNLLNKTQKENLDKVDIISTETVAKLAGVKPSKIGAAVFYDTKTPEFNKLRKDLRRVAIGLNKDTATPFDAMHEVGHMVIRSGALKPDEKQAIVDLYRGADDIIKTKINSQYASKYADYTNESLEDLLAEEWFSEQLALYMSERVSKGNLLNSVLNRDVSNLKLRNAFERAIDRTVEYVAYVVNGLIGRNSIKQEFRRLVMFGDMFEKPNVAPMSDAIAKSGPALHPSTATNAVNDLVLSSPEWRLEKIKEFTGNGLGYNPKVDSIITFYHGTPNGYAFNRADNPDVVLNPSVNGFYGPGVYISDNPSVASQTYAKKPTPESQNRAIMESDNTDEIKEELIFEVQDLHDVRKEISAKRRAYYLENVGDQDKTRLSVLKKELDELVEMEQASLDNLTKHGITTDPLVIPLYVNVQNPADFQKSASYNISDGLVGAVLEYFQATDSIKPKAIREFSDKLSNPTNGRDTYLALTQLLRDSGRGIHQAKTELNGALEDLGYDGIITTHFNTTNVDGTPRMRNQETYEGDFVSHKGVLVFDTANVKHVDAAEFNEADARLYHSPEAGIPKAINGGIIEAMMAEKLGGLDTINPGLIGESVEKAGGDSSLSGAMMSMIKGRQLNANEEQALKDNSVGKIFSSQSGRMKRMGANWIADWYKQHFSDVQQRFAGKFFPIQEKLRNLPDAHGRINSWYRRGPRQFFTRDTQPESYQRIVRALRNGDGSRQHSALSKQELEIYDDVRNAFETEHQSLTQAGIMVGRRENYLPQVWNKEAIDKNRGKFLEGMRQYYIDEQAGFGKMVNEADAQEFARRMYETLAGEGSDGVFIPHRGGSRNPTSDAIDYNRVIELEKYPNHMANMEEFLEHDLEFLLTKYFEGSSRRLAHTEKLGINSHAWYDYMHVAEHGKSGIAKLLSTPREFTWNKYGLDLDGNMTQYDLTDTVTMPFLNREGEASAFVDGLVEEYQRHGIASARKLLMDVAPVDSSGIPTEGYVKRAEAILGALQDFKGDKAPSWTNEDFRFMDKSLAVAMKKPQDADYNRALMKMSKTVRGFNNISLLGFTTLTSLGDLVLPLIRSGSMQDYVKGLSKWARDPDYRRFMYNTGVAIENILHERQLYMYGGTGSKLSNAFFNTTLLTPWTDLNRQFAGSVGFESFKTMQAKANRHYNPRMSFDKQSVEYKQAHRYLKGYGLEKFLPEGTEGKVSLDSTEALTKFADDKELRQAIIRFADESIFQPNQNDIPLWAQTPWGAMIFQLKSFTLMMQKMSWDVWKEAMSKDGRKAPLMYALSVGPAFGAFSLAAKDTIQLRGGDTEREADVRVRNALKFMGYDKKIHGNEHDVLGWYLEGIMHMGGLGLFGELAHNAATQADNGAYGVNRLMSNIGGPSVGLFQDSVHVIGGVKDAILGSTDSNAKERTAVRTVATRIPIVGGVRDWREGITDAVAGEPTGRKKKQNGWGSEWQKGWGNKW